MFNFWPDKRWFGFDIEPLEEPPGFMMHANGPSREGSPGDAIFSLQPGQDVPGLHNFRPPEEFVPGFHLSADGSLPGEVAPLNSDVGGSPSSVGNAWPYLANGMETYNGQDGVPALASDPTQPTYVAPFAALRSASLFSGNPYLNIGNSSLPVGAVSPPSSGLSFAREEPSFSYQMNQNTGSGGALVPEASQVFEGSQAGSDQITNHGIFRVADGDVSPVDEQNRRPSDRPTGVLTDRVTPAMEADPRETTPSVEGTELAQAEAPDQQTQNVPEKWPGVAVVLPDGSTLPNAESPTGQVMSPVADLSSVAAAGRRAGFIHHAMLMQPLTAFGAPAFMIWALRENLRQGGALDYQRAPLRDYMLD